jgi:pimeloyl-ACP methyl ester carboxylesterase
MLHPRSAPAVAAAAVLLLALPLPAARADATKGGARIMIVLDGGFVIQGMDRREGHEEIAEPGVSIFIPSGFFFLDDMPRRQYFSPSMMKQDPQQVTRQPPEPLRPKNKDIATPPKAMPPVDEVLTPPSEWGEDSWDRVVKFRSGLKEEKLHQRLVELTPYYARTQATQNWTGLSFYLTSELGPAAVRKLLDSHPDFTDDSKLAPDAQAERRFRYCDFMVQCGFYAEAEAELDRLMDSGPADAVKEKVASTRGAINQLRRREELEAIKQMHNAGQFAAVRKKLEAFDVKSADAKTASEVNELRQKYKTADQAMTDASRFLDELPKKLGSSAAETTLAEAAAALRAELQPDVLARLDAFLGQARQAERQAANGKTPSAGPAELLSFAVTAWLGLPPQGSPQTAARIWRGRQFVLKYLGADAADRKNLLNDYSRNTDGQATLDDFIGLIPLLPPAEPEEKIDTKPVLVKAGKSKNAVKYWLQLPPEYRHSRNYPVLIVLHDGNEDPDNAIIKHWSDAAALNGYILVAPEWSQAGSSLYGYSEREHAAVLETLRDLRQRFAVDSDRVFLFGLGQGAMMAFDVGLSHPDLFAGVMPMSGGPYIFAERYYPNGQYLPFYIVSGDRAIRVASGDKSNKTMTEHLRDQFGNWVNQYPMIWMQYKGRGVEWFGGEVASMFDWMRGRRRAFPMEGLGAYNDNAIARKDFVTHRPTDNSFYWLTTDGIQDRCINSETDWKLSRLPARLEAKIDLENNTIWVDTSGVTQITLWLGSNGQGVPMINFDKPLTVRWKSGASDKVVWNDRVTRSLQTLLDDLADRGDRQRLFTTKLEFSTK